MVLTELLSFDCISKLHQLATLLPYGIQLPKSLRFRQNRLWISIDTIYSFDLHPRRFPSSVLVASLGAGQWRLQRLGGGGVGMLQIFTQAFINPETLQGHSAP